jgi:hypothetical protein
MDSLSPGQRRDLDACGFLSVDEGRYVVVSAENLRRWIDRSEPVPASLDRMLEDAPGATASPSEEEEDRREREAIGRYSMRVIAARLREES